MQVLPALLLRPLPTQCSLRLLCRVCVDLCSSMVPGEGLLVGSFARGLFLVQAECQESDYINSRPFRVNAGPVSLAQPSSPCTAAV